MHSIHYCIGVVVLAAIIAWYHTLSNVPSTFLHVPQDVEWFSPNQLGWLCDYGYVLNQDGSGALKIKPRNTALGRIMVYSTYSISFVDQTDERHGHVNKFYAKLKDEINNGRKHLLEDNGDWVAVAVFNENFDRMFAVTAKYGDSTAFVRLVSSFEVGQEIPLNDTKFGDLTIGKVKFPGIPGTDEVIHAYA